MDISEVEFNNLKLLAANVTPSRYLFNPSDVAKLISWQIVMADNSVRDILFAEIGSGGNFKSVGSSIRFNAKSMPISGFQDFDVETLKFKVADSNKYEIVFTPEDVENLACQPRIVYKLSELYFHLEIAVTNRSGMPIYWRPEIHFFVTLPWTDETPLEKYIVKSVAKKRLRMADDLSIISSTKSSEKIPLDALENGTFGLTQLSDSKIWIGTSNEEEGISFIFGNKTPKSVFVMRKTATANKVEAAFLSDLPSATDGTVSNGDMQNYMAIAPNRTGSFSAEISAY
ncbi:MAG: hypothetical protein LBT64_01345 [Puniceicoccales bacterium]|jgi:hypothetical protein|nr:hypothetical protein [Puniceicoccales bacterium]